ncbi:MAG: ATP-dependent helicase [Cyanobacteriota bacterium]|nr:ATP-dependent helicase [Cyanobacteriota bacterium]
MRRPPARFPDAAELSGDQQAAAEAFVAWLATPEDGTPFLLRGYAGTGKTFLSMRFLAHAEAQGLCWTVVAPTHKAVGVLRDHLEQVGLSPTWFPSTIHRLLRLKLRREGDRERCSETAQTATALEHLGLVLIDEASMVDGQLLEITLRCAQPFRCRLVFIGDPAQLPPVGERESPVFSLARVHQASLTHVVRHQGPILRLASGLRQGALPCRRPPLLPPCRTERGMVALLDREEWLLAAQKALRRCTETDNPDLARILCYTNRTLETLVPIARRALHGELSDTMPVLPGEVLITRSPVMGPACVEDAKAPEDPELCLSSNREVVVRDVTPGLYALAPRGSGESELLEGDFGGEGPSVIDTLMVSVDAGEGRLTLRLLPPIGSAPRLALDQALQRLRSAARSAEPTEARTIWRRFFLLRDAFASLGPAAVLTVHRSQGSTFGEVFVARDVFWPQEEQLRRQLAYVAVSRASQGVTMEAGPASAADQVLWRDWLSGPDPAATAG